ncbi:heparinase II/III domain-containing protein [Thalassobellus sediminis]|uniref:heparinase II/III domain-containing protein n=1 Tax=Thalassobellus sediminis TaxID=3367753 RepID=UPI003F6E13AE
MKRLIVLIGLLILIINIDSNAQELPVPESMGELHPRVFGQNMELDDVKKLVENKKWAYQIINKTKNRLEKYINLIEKDSTWLVSRLQMYWNTKSTQVYINGGKYDHAEGKAPVPTVKFIGGRGTPSDYKRPKLEDVKPYMDDPRGLYLHNKTTNTWEWAAIPSTSGITASINREILSIARDAAFLYWYQGDKKYADLAYNVLNTYLKGVYYLNEPIDLSHGHHQTLVSYTQFEVIQEHVLNEVTQCYDFLHKYIKTSHPNGLKIFAATLQKWADLIIKNGVSFNNWNLLQAAHISNIALVLENNDYYENGKGGPYYLNLVMNKTSTRQWSMKKMMDYGYDYNTGVWNESPGYSMNVLNDFIHFAEFYDRNFNIDLIKEMPVLKQSVITAPEYLYPNKFKVAFGDGHYKHLRSEPIKYLIENAQKYNKQEDEIYFTKMLKTIYDEHEYESDFVGRKISDLFSHEGLKLDKDIEIGKLTDFTSPLFYAPNTSWLVQRQGNIENDALMISQIGSLGNHMHSNGIAMELYGKGLPLAPEMGHGSSYFSIEYAEYYTQFPAHNTVIVNGKSKYPEMKSNHAFKVLGMYPKSKNKEGNLNGYTFSDVVFLEPETHSDQRRVLGIIKNKEGGFYIDIFRSKQKENKDVKHEYFFHNLGHKLSLTNANNEPFKLKPTSSLAFGDGDLMAYDYMWNKESVKTNADFKGQFSLKMENRTVNMNLWFKGEENREVFSVMSPKSTAFRHGPLPKEMNNNPIPTLVVKQNGEAWSRPFVAIYEPAENGDTAIKTVDYFGNKENVGIHVIEKTGKENFVFSNTDTNDILATKQLFVKGTYAVISRQNKGFTLFLGKGKSISNATYTLEVKGNPASASLKKENNQWFLSTEGVTDLKVKVSNKIKKALLTDASGKEYIGKYDRKSKSVVFNLPVLSYQAIKMVIN